MSAGHLQNWSGQVGPVGPALKSWSFFWPDLTDSRSVQIGPAVPTPITWPDRPDFQIQRSGHLKPQENKDWPDRPDRPDLFLRGRKKITMPRPKTAIRETGQADWASKTPPLLILMGWPEPGRR